MCPQEMGSEATKRKIPYDKWPQLDYFILSTHTNDIPLPSVLH